MGNEKQQKPNQERSFPYKTSLFLITTLAIYGLMRKGNYRAAIEFYPKKGGGGLNIYKQIESKSRRQFGIDYHPFWNHKTQKSEWKLHYHRGRDKESMKKHRPYDGW